MTLADQGPLDLNGVHQFRQWLASHHRVLIGAGAGLSASAGIDFADKATFARLFPTLVRRGFEADYQLIGFEDWEPAEKWGYLATHVNYIRFGPGPHPLYTGLFDLVRAKDYFVITSNVDALFARNGFDEDRIFTPQGNYAAMQCLTPCQQRVWPSQPIIEKLLPVIDPRTQWVTDPATLPRCPSCGGEVFLNVRGGDWFVEAPFLGQHDCFRNWLGQAAEEPLLIIEIGAGFNTPGVIRWPLQSIARANRKSTFVRINAEHAGIPKELTSRALSFRSDALHVINEIGATNNDAIHA